jgi:hypothetical protein
MVRSTHHAARRQDRTAARVVVELGDDDAREFQRVVEGACGVHGVLAGDGVNDQEGVMRRRLGADRSHLSHQRFVDRQATRRVDDHHVATKSLRLGDTGARDRHGIGGVGVDLDADLGGQHAQLLDGRRALQVGTDQVRLATLLFEPLRQLGRRGRLARSL